MITIITSDLHLGSSHTDVPRFLAFLDALPPGATLVLNGDTVCHFTHEHRLPDDQKAVLARLRAESEQRPIIWIHGNNDLHFKLTDPRGIEVRDHWTIDQRLYIAHGHSFDLMMPALRPVLLILRLGHDALNALSPKGRHVAQAAKRFGFFYRVLCRHVANRATRYAAAHGYAAVTCGHTHYTEDALINGVRYLNTNAWTEPDPHYVKVTPASITLERVA